MADELRVKIGADVKGLDRGLKEAESKLGKFDRATNRSGKQVGKFGKSIEANALPATQEFSRVIQDAPFGIQGVGNNIQQLTAQFGSLSKRAGGSAAALRLMLGSLAGPAGMLLAVSAVTSLLTVFADKLKFSASETKKLAEATAEFLGEAKAEVSALKTLINIAQDENNSKEQRLGAIKELNDKYSDYLGNLDLETVKTDKVTTSVNALTKSILQRAKVQGLQKLITETTGDASEKLAKAELDRQKALDRLDTSIKKAINGNAALRRSLEGVEGRRNQIRELRELAQGNGLLADAARRAGIGVNIALDSFKSASNEVKTLNKDLDDALRPLVRLDEAFKKDLFDFEADAKIQFDQEEVVIEGNKTKTAAEEYFKNNPVKIVSEFITSDQIDQGQQEIRATADNVGLGFDPTSLTAAIPNVTPAIDGLMAKQNQLLENSQLVGQGVSDVFNNLGNNIANSLGATRGALGAFVGTFIQTGLKIISQALLTSKALAVQSAAQTSVAKGPAAAFILPALVAGALAVIGSAFSGIGGGGSSSGVGGSGSGDFNGVNSSTVGSGSGGGRVVFEIAGNKLIGVLNNTLDGNSQIGDTVGID